ncbi:MAG: DUF4221 domain-containing protein [Bacteroides oleiciplenus]|nr:DUF4221 domain-containing protein [Bacteroides oleiciplenus]
MKYRTFIILPVLLFLFSCSGTKKQNTGEPANAMELKTEEILFPASEVLNLKSYYLSATFQNDSLNLLYGYNYKSHALDCIDLNRRQLSQIPLSREGESAVMRDMCGLYIQAPDSIWLYDGSQRILLINSRGKLLKVVDLRPDLKDSEQVLINTNHAMSTAHLFYDRKHNSLLYGIKDFSTSPISFRVRETFLDGTTASINYPLQPSVVVTNVTGRDYGNMADLNISFVEDKIIYNYPVESHVYIVNRINGKQEVVEADSRFTKNEVEKCESGSYDRWERHNIENPHFYDVMYLPQQKMYARLHLGGIEFDDTVDRLKLMDNRDLYLTLFAEDFTVVGEAKLSPHRYNYFTGWTGTGDGVVLFVDNSLDENEKTEELAVDIVRPKAD